MRGSDWAWAAFGFALMTAYWPGIAGAATTPRWDVAALLVAPLFVSRRIPMSAAHWVGLALIGWLFASLYWSGGRLDGINAAFQLVLIACAFAIGSLAEDLGPVFVGAGLGLAVSSVAAVAQALGWDGVPSYLLPAGLFYNGDRLAAAAALVAVGLIGLGRPWVAVLLLPALVLPGSRAAWLAVAVGLMALPLRTERFGLIFWARAGGFVAAVLTLLYRYGAGAGGRIELWTDTINGLTFWGHGLGSFRSTFPGLAQHFDLAVQGTWPEHPHNELLWLAFEGGAPAVVLAGALVGLLAWESWDSEDRGILACLAVLACFAMPMHDPATAVLGAVVAGRCAARRLLVRGLIVDGRNSLCPRLAACIRGSGAG